MPDTSAGFIDAAFLEKEGAKALSANSRDRRIAPAAVVAWLRKGFLAILTRRLTSTHGETMPQRGAAPSYYVPTGMTVRLHPNTERPPRSAVTLRQSR